MKLKIKVDAGTIYHHNYYKDVSPHHCAPASVRAFIDKIAAIQGMTMEVDTKYLWDDQFNTMPIDGISSTGLRILDYPGETSIIEEVIDDERPFRTKCGYCGHYLRKDDVIAGPCWWCGK